MKTVFNLMALMACSWSLSAQTRTVKSVVVSETTVVGATSCQWRSGHIDDLEGAFDSLNVGSNVKEIQCLTSVCTPRRCAYVWQADAHRAYPLRPFCSICAP